MYIKKKNYITNLQLIKLFLNIIRKIFFIFIYKILNNNK